MDCEKFDRVVLDLLYEELDELTAAAAKRHTEHCMRCRSICAGLRATREVGLPPLVDLPEGLELRILEAERNELRLLPIGKRLGRGVSLVAGYAMRPQLAMAALLMLMIGSSLFFLRAQPSDRDRVMVTERGEPENDTDTDNVALSKLGPPAIADELHAPRTGPRADERQPKRERPSEPKPGQHDAPTPAPATAPLGSARQLTGTTDDATSEAAGDTDASYDAAMAAYHDARYSEAQRRFAAIADQGGAHAASAALYEVQALRMVSGCPVAAPRFDEVHSRYPDSVGSDAAWQAADCFRSIGELTRARQDYEDLLKDPNYRVRAREALHDLEQYQATQELTAKKAGAAVPKVSTPSLTTSAAPVASGAKPSP